MTRAGGLGKTPGMFAFLALFLTQSALAQAPGDERPDDAFWEALRADDIAGVVEQIDLGISPNSATPAETPLCYAIKRVSIEMVAMLLDRGANPNLAEPISAYSPLMVAAKHQNAQAVDLLLNHQANVNQTSVFGRNALNMAALHNSLEVGHILLTKTNIDVNARGKLCPLAIAARQGHADFVKMILDEAKVPPTPKCLTSAIDMAAHNHHEDVLKILKTR